MGSLLQDLRQDLQQALRRLVKSPGFTALALATLALAIGANTAVFSVVDAVLLSPLPYAEPERIVRVEHLRAEGGPAEQSFSPQDFTDLAQAGAGFERLAAYFFTPGLTTMNLIGAGDPLAVSVASVSGEFFPLFGVPAALGRPLAPADDVVGASQVVVLSDALWRRRFGADPAIIGRGLSLDGQPYTVAGVMPASFLYPSRQAEIWVPLARVDDSMVPHKRFLRWLDVVGRLAPGTTPAAAGAATDAVLARLEAQYPDSNQGWGRATLVPLRQSLTGDVRPALLVLLGAVGLVLLIACANLASLLLARGAGRAHEIAVRTALGARRRRLVRQMLTENLLLGLAGGAFGLLLSLWGVAALPALAGGGVPLPETIAPDARVIAFALLASLAAGLLAGLVPALRASGLGAAELLKEGGRGGGEGRERQAARGLLIVAETALAVVLLTGAGLMLESLWRLARVDPGFDAGHVLTLSLRIPYEQLGGPPEVAAYRERLLDRLAALPGVKAVGAAKTLPLHGGAEPYGLSPADWSGPEDERPTTGVYIVTPGYFRALGIPLLAGRELTRDDRPGAPPVVVVNQTLARRWFGGEPAVGRFLVSGSFRVEIVGVAGDVRNAGITEPPQPDVYVPSALASRSSMKLFLRAAGSPAAIAGAAQRAIWEVNPAQPISDVRPLAEEVSDALARPRFFALLLGLFAAIALVLAGLGTYGIVSYGVSRRTHEIGIRMALGARRGEVLGMVVARAMGLALAGIALGVAGSFAATRLMASLLYGVGATDPTAFAAAPLLLAAAALLASFLPARRAAGLDPTIALRHE